MGGLVVGAFIRPCKPKPISFLCWKPEGVPIYWSLFPFMVAVPSP